MDPLVPRLQTHVQALSVVRDVRTNPEGHRFARQYIGTQLGSFGFEVVEQHVAGQPPEERNVVARPAGAPGNPRLLIEAHYDTVPGSPGADDNASGIALLLEIARQLGPIPGIAFAAFCLEEDRAQGARAYATSLEGGDCPYAICLEMVGYTRPRFDRYIAVLGLWKSRRLVMSVTRACIRERLPALPLTFPRIEKLSPDALRGNHAELERYGVGAVMLTDTANFRNPHYHTADDLPDTLDYPFMARLCRALLGLAGRKVARSPLVG